MDFKGLVFKQSQDKSLNLLVEEQNLADKLVLEQQTVELYQKDHESIALKPTYETDTLVADLDISHVDLPQTLLDRHRGIFNNLRTKIDGADEETALHRRMEKFIGHWKGDADVQVLLGSYYKVENGEISIDRQSAAINEASIKGNNDNASSALFNLSRFALDDFHRMSALRRDVLRLKRAKLLKRKNSLRKRSILENDIDAVRADFENNEATRLRSEENYSIVRGLLEEQLKAVDEAFNERQRILSQPLGLSYVRINDLPMQVDYQHSDLIAEPAPDRLPTSCKAAPELAQRMQGFIELLSDQPMSSWRRLRPYWRWLPRQWLVQPPQRQLPQFQHSLSLLPSVFQVLQRALPKQARPAIEAKRHLSVSTGSRQLADELTLEQLTKAGNVRLRQRARRLQDDLETATACLIEQLTEVPASLRYEWSRLAEDDALNTEKLLSWPGFHSLAGEATGLRLREIHQWLQLQLDRNADQEARTAIRTLIRACLLQAVNDDPEELLTGEVIEFPSIIKPGVLVTANLNRIPQLSTPLKLYDSNRQLLAEAKIVDSRDTQASIEIVSAYQATPQTFSAWTVIGRRFNAGLD